MVKSPVGPAFACAVVGCLALTAGAERAAGERVPVRACETRVESGLFTRAELPPFYRSRAVRAGPVVFIAGEYATRPATDFAPVPGRPGRYHAQKLLLLVRAGTVATVSVARRDRDAFSLLYDRRKWSRPYRLGYRIGEGDTATTFQACRAAEPRFSGGGTVGAWTEFNGGVLVAGARCVAIDVRVVASRLPIRRYLAFGIPKRACHIRRDAVLYGIGVSTDPYGESRPRGFGVATGILAGRVRKSEVVSAGLGWYPMSWLAGGRIVVPRRAPPFRPPLVFRFRAGVVRRIGPAPLRPLELRGIWSPDARLVATEPIVVADCGRGTRPGLTCWREGGVVYVARADGSRRHGVWRGHLAGWAPDGRLLVADRRYSRYLTLDLATGRTRELVTGDALRRFAGVRGAIDSKPIWSADRRYLAAHAGFFWPKKERRRRVNEFVIARADGRIVRLVSSRYIVSMLAWSPVGHRLAWTTSGFPDPHELFVLDQPDARPRKIFGTSNRHFDWVTWSPSGRYLLLDDAKWGSDGRWALFDVASGKVAQVLPRLGGRPLWCCPEGASVTR
jgi:hypothetical protein